MSIVTEKYCPKCGENKSVSEFGADKKKKDGLRYQCKACDSAYARAWQLANPERNRKNKLSWIKNNRDKENARIKKWKDNNPEKAKGLWQRFKENHPDLVRERIKAWVKAHPEKAIETVHKRRARVAGVGGTITPQEFKDLCDKYGNKCLCCGKSNVKLTIDHVTPIFLGGKNVIENAQPLCGKCNSSKGIKVIDYR